MLKSTSIHDSPEASHYTAAAHASRARWFLVFTKPASESLAKLHLERQRYKVYYPRVLVGSLRGDRWVERIASLFPRYLFLHIDPDKQSLAPVRSTAGVAKVVQFGSEPAVVPNHVIDALIWTADPHSGLHRLQRNVLRSGAGVQVLGGALAGLEGVFEREVGEERVSILLSLLGRSISVRVSARFVAPSCV